VEPKQPTQEFLGENIIPMREPPNSFNTVCEIVRHICFAFHAVIICNKLQICIWSPSLRSPDDQRFLEEMVYTSVGNLKTNKNHSAASMQQMSVDCEWTAQHSSLAYSSGRTVLNRCQQTAYFNRPRDMYTGEMVKGLGMRIETSLFTMGRVAFTAVHLWCL